MRIFICWSGLRSKQIALTLRGWLPQVLPGLDPFISQDIPKGSRWFEAVGLQLQEAAAGLICMTPDNVSSPWLHYEAGALANKLATATGPSSTGYIFTYLDGVTPGELQGPLEAYQSTISDEADTQQLVKALARLLHPEKAAYKQWEAQLQAQWPEAWRQLVQALKQPLLLPELLPEFAQLFQRKTFDESLAQCTEQNWARRVVVANEVLAILRKNNRTIRQYCRGYVADLYSELVAQLDGYDMDVSALLTKRFELGEDGLLQIEPKGILQVCEKRRLRIKELVAQILDPLDAPIVDEAWRYAQLDTFQERKRYIHRQEASIHNQGLCYDQASHYAYLDSSWEFERIVGYLILENTPGTDPTLPLDCINHELERLEALTKQGSLIPLHYAIRALGAALDHQPKTEQIRGKSEELLVRVEAYLAAARKRDEGGQMRRNIATVRSRLKESSIQDRHEKHATNGELSTHSERIGKPGLP